MLNGRNWWTDTPVTYDYTEDFNKRVEDAAKMVWEKNADHGGDIKGLSDFVDAVKQVLGIINKPRIDQEKSA
jgi:hypothetical protein